MSLIPNGLAKSGVAAFYTKDVGGSLCFDSGSSSYLSRTPASAGNRKTWTWSGWIKRNIISTAEKTFFGSGYNFSNFTAFAWLNDKLFLQNYTGGTQVTATTTAVFRDPSAWYHVVLAVDTTQSTAADRLKLYVNGVQDSGFTGSSISLNQEFWINSTYHHSLGARAATSFDSFADLYFAEVHFTDGNAYTADDFGELKSGVWIAKAPSVTYGTNGFYLDMVSSNFSSPTLSDSSGNSNNWTVSGIGSNDFVLDSPTNNYAVMNYWWPYNSANQNVTYSEGNRKYAMGSSNSRGAATMEVLADGCYFEVLFKSNKGSVGVQSIDGAVRYVWNAVNSGELANIGGTSGATFVDGDIVAIAVGTDGNIKRYLNGSLQASDNTLTGYTAGDPLLPLIGEFDTAGSNTAIVNFGQDSTFAGNKTRQGNTDENGQGDFYYTPPTGFVALCTANMPTPAADPASDVEPRDYFETFLWEGNGGGQQVGDVIKKPADTTTISNSLIFDDADSGYYTRTNASAGTRTTYTISCWLKRGNVGTATVPIFGSNSGSDWDMLYISSADVVAFSQSTEAVSNFRSDAKLKDASKWYHLVLAVDTTQATSTDRVKLYIDGVLATFSTALYPPQNEPSNINANGTVHYIGKHPTSSSYYDGYLAEFHFVDGTAHAATDFGNFDANGIWIPKAVTGITYGTNGFYLDFADNTSTTTLGDDESGNTNDYTPNGSIATTDQVADSPTDNFMTMSSSYDFSGGTFSEGNLKVVTGTSQYGTANSSFALKKGKYYCEMTQGSGLYTQFGCVSADASLSTTTGVESSAAKGFCYVQNDGSYRSEGVVTSGFGSSWTNGDVIAMALNLDDLEVTFYKNGVSQGTKSIASGRKYLIAISDNDGGTGTTCTFNFGQRDFTYTPPTGFTAISENNITVDDQNLESPDLVWVKNRDNADNHYIYDEVRGVAKAWASDDFYAEIATPNGLIDFNTNGFTVGNDGGLNRANQSYVAWTWKANGSGVDSTSQMGGAGTGSSATTSANSDLGIGITKYYIGSSPDTYKAIPHGLGATPEFIIVKNLDSGQWPVVHHHKLGTNGYLNLGLNTNAAQSDISYFRTGYFDSTNFYVGGANETGTASTNFISYCFVGKEGFSKFGIYDDSYYSDYNADGPFIYCGFRPAWIFIKSTSGGRPFVIYDNKRSPVNPAILWLQPDTTHGDQSDGTNHDIDFMANGFKVKGGSGDVNTTGENYIFAAFAEMPFKYATAR